MQNSLNDTVFIGKVFVELKEVDSTNDYAVNLLSKEYPIEGTTIFAHAQLKGKGQYGKSWESEPNMNVSLSTILYPLFLQVDKQFNLNKAIALALYDFIKAYLDDTVKIKWPNDILRKNQKIAGILIQNNISRDSLTSSVVGIGININQTNFERYAIKPTSFKLITGKDFDVLQLANELCGYIESRYLLLKAGKFEVLEKDYLKALYGYQEHREYKSAQGIIEGQILGVTPEGKLILKSEGKLHRFGFREIEFVI